MTPPWWRSAAGVALALVLVGVAVTGAHAAWLSGAQVEATVTTASFSYPDGAAAPPPPVLDVEDGPDRASVLLRWPRTALSGPDGRALLDYDVRAHVDDEGSLVECPTAAWGEWITCRPSGPVPDGTTRFSVQPRFQNWVGERSALSAPLAGVTGSAEVPGEDAG